MHDSGLHPSGMAVGAGHPGDSQCGQNTVPDDKTTFAERQCHHRGSTKGRSLKVGEKEQVAGLI